MSILRNSLLSLVLLCGHGVRSQDNKMYSYLEENRTILRNGDSESDFIKLDSPIHFFSQTYDRIFINTNGILTFKTALPEFENHHFPLKYPSIAVFYSNMDTTAANESTQISIFKSQSPDNLSKAADLAGSDNFTTMVLYVATWEKVGYYKKNNDKLNTFQAAIICNQDDTYVQLIYPSNGLNWLKANVGELGIPDIQAQAGFMSEDSRYYTLPGSGTDNVKYLSTLSNVDIPGVWLFRVGSLSYGQNVVLPSLQDSADVESEPKSCTDGSNKCHLYAVCIDNAEGFCCKCNEGYYGNGIKCIQSTTPIQVLRSISGSINRKRLDRHPQVVSYVTIADGLTYTAIDPISEELGHQLEMALPLGGSIGWLFREPFGKAKNGFEITGGTLNHWSSLIFPISGEIFVVNQTFEGFNYLNQLIVKIKVSGNLPIIPVGSKPQMADFMEDYRYIDDTEIQSVGTRQIRVSDRQNIVYILDQRITFKRCRLDNETSLASEGPVIRNVSKVSWEYDSVEQAIRIVLLNRTEVDLESNHTDLNQSECHKVENETMVACNAGYQYDEKRSTCIRLISCFQDYNCHEVATCEWSEDVQQHKCICPQGYEGDGITCTEIEVFCNTKPDICDIHATCLYNETIGKPECRCNNGYEWNGFWCLQLPTCSTNSQCRAHSKCENGICRCLAGYERVFTDFCEPDKCDKHRPFSPCAANALCKIKKIGIERMSYCECMEGFVGNGFNSCEKLPPPCNIQNTCSLHATCAPSNKSPFLHECICNPGYYGDGYLCVNERNCQNTPSLCDRNGRCVTTSIRPECSCNYGYVGNGTYCKEENYMSDLGDFKVLLIPIDEKFGKPISVARMAFGLDKDCVEKRIYWGDVSAKMIMSSKYDGKDEKPFVTEDILSPDDIAIDWMSRRLYWTDSIKATIEVVSLDNPKQRAVLVNKNLVYPRGIAVDPHKSKIYWSDWYRDAPKIEMAELDGTGREILLSKPDVILPNSLAVQRSTGDLCFADGGTYKIGCVDTCTKSVRTIAANLSYPFGLTSTDQIFLWINWNTKQIDMVDINGSRETGRYTIIFGGGKMYGMVPITDGCRVNYSPCLVDNGGCPEDRICLINQRAPSGKSCKCDLNESDCHTLICNAGYQYDEKRSTCIRLISCFQDYNCHEKATCEWSEDVQQHKCICPQGYEGDGITCTEIEVFCNTKPDICDIHATCLYNETIGKPECRCNNGYEWNGFWCLQLPTCSTNSQCRAHSKCENGICRCLAGYERVFTDFCEPDKCDKHRPFSPCAANALCKIKKIGIERMSYCECMEGFVGNGFNSCEKLPPPCNIQNTCSLHATCAPSKKSPFLHECICNPGYYGDGYLCVNERNCQNTPSLCDRNGRCVTTSIRPECRCNYGYVGNGTYCKEENYMSDLGDFKVLLIPIDEKFGKPISVARMAFGLDKDCVEKRIYWGDVSAKMIMSSKYDGKDEKPFVTEDILSPDDIAIDWMSRRLYWTDSIKATIEVVSLDNPKQRAVLVNKNLVYPRGIAVDPHKSKIYWSDWYRDAPKIEMAELDGTGREILLTKPDVILPNSLAVQRSTGELCFADGGTYKIGCVDTSTKLVRTIAANLSYPFGLTSTDQIFLWINWTTKQIDMVDINGSRETGRRTIIFGSVKMYGMVPIKDGCRVDYSPCLVDNGGCPEDRICLINQRAPSGKSCKC